MDLELFLDIELYFEKNAFSHPNAKADLYLKILELVNFGQYELFFSLMEKQIQGLGQSKNNVFEKGCCFP